MKYKDNTIQSSRRDPLFDSIKGIAILGIMLVHLGQWNLNFAEESRFFVARSAGALGVELTFLVNGFFMNKANDEHRFRGGYILKSFASLIPIYWFSLLVYGISTYMANGNLECDVINICSHFLFLNGFSPIWWSSYMGGSGYFGVLALMWLSYPLCLKRTKDLKTCFFNSLFFMSFGYLLCMALRIVLNNILILQTSIIGDWTWYINRGFYSYAFSGLLYYCYKEFDLSEIPLNNRKLIAYIVLIMISVLCFLKGSALDGITFLFLWCCVILIAKESRLTFIDNKILSFFGRYITELFVSHILLFYILVRNQKILVEGPSTFGLLFLLTIIFSIVLNRLISVPTKKIVSKLCK